MTTYRSGKSYEFQVMRHLVEERQHISFELDANIPDTTGQYERQIDIWLPSTREIVECKYRQKSPVGIGVIDSLVGASQDVDAAAASIYSSSGFSRRAVIRAQKAGIACTTLGLATTFETRFPPAGGGYYSGEYFELCPCAGMHSQTDNLWGRINYLDAEGGADLICTALSIEWGNVKAHRFIAYLLLVHVLSRPPADAEINSFVESYGERFEAGQEWVISEYEVRSCT
jgi:hypothetical protein